MIDIDALETLARDIGQAWFHSHSELWAAVTTKPHGQGSIVAETRDVVCHAQMYAAARLAEYIAAANPQATLELCQRVRSLQVDNDLLRTGNVALLERASGNEQRIAALETALRGMLEKASRYRKAAKMLLEGKP